MPTVAGLGEAGAKSEGEGVGTITQAPIVVGIARTGSVSKGANGVLTNITPSHTLTLTMVAVVATVVST